jgi:DNA-binding transcriptional regulator YhcF (GntR family)
MDFRLDRELPIPVATQLRGLIEYGIAGGDLRPGEQLPSVREMADLIGVAPMTVSKVYDELKRLGLIHGRVGAGTFVVDTGRPVASPLRGAGDLYRRIDRLIDDSIALGLRSSDLAGMISSRMVDRRARAGRPAIVIVGNFEPATSDYAKAIEELLGPIATVESVTFDDMQEKADVLPRVEAANLVLTFANRRRAVQELLPTSTVVAISLIPAETTRRSLASLDPRTRVLGITQFPDFSAQMKSGLRRFAPHISDVTMAVVDAPHIDALLRDCDVLVYGTGAESVLSRLPENVTSFEFRHTPDAADVRRVVLPLIAPSKATDHNEHAEKRS